VLQAFRQEEQQQWVAEQLARLMQQVQNQMDSHWAGEQELVAA
jgi:hypothetical protein